jgi:ABC-type uncharacterized transport system substrate-binding protein
MQRRDLIKVVAGSLATWPLAARAQQPAMPVVGFMMAGSRAALRDEITAFEAGLKEMGFFEGQNLALEYRFAEGQFDRFPEFASDLVHRQASVIAASSPQGAFAAKAGDDGNPDRLFHRRRSHRSRACTEPQPAGRQCDRSLPIYSGAGGETARAIARNGP